MATEIDNGAVSMLSVVTHLSPLAPMFWRVEDNEPSDRSSQDRKSKRSEDKIEGRPTRVTFADVVKGKVNVRSGAADVNETP
jgi:hypothetical protein